MYEVVKAINKFAEEIFVDTETGLELTKLFAEALFADARENGELLDEFPNDEDKSGASGAITVNITPEIDTSKIKEAFAKINSVF